MGGETLEEFLDYFKNENNLEITMFSLGFCTLYSYYLEEDKKLERLCLSMPEVVKTVPGIR